ncbi:mucin-17 [Aplysia californica]|uniref:Mucin-17 n=1 Tax=Aplysia californica TaxID=6500 RepID=A0ABM1A3M3_APLCA|nr:mucin-17 [Aplysia californica]
MDRSLGTSPVTTGETDHHSTAADHHHQYHQYSTDTDDPSDSLALPSSSSPGPRPVAQGHHVTFQSTTRLVEPVIPSRSFSEIPSPSSNYFTPHETDYQKQNSQSLYYSDVSQHTGQTNTFTERTQRSGDLPQRSLNEVWNRPLLGALQNNTLLAPSFEFGSSVHDVGANSQTVQSDSDLSVASTSQFERDIQNLKASLSSSQFSDSDQDSEIISTSQFEDGDHIGVVRSSQLLKDSRDLQDVLTSQSIKTRKDVTVEQTSQSVDSSENPDVGFLSQPRESSEDLNSPPTSQLLEAAENVNVLASSDSVHNTRDLRDVPSSRILTTSNAVRATPPLPSPTVSITSFRPVSNSGEENPFPSSDIPTTGYSVSKVHLSFHWDLSTSPTFSEFSGTINLLSDSSSLRLNTSVEYFVSSLGHAYLPHIQQEETNRTHDNDLFQTFSPKIPHFEQTQSAHSFAPVENTRRLVFESQSVVLTFPESSKSYQYSQASHLSISVPNPPSPHTPVSPLGDESDVVLLSPSFVSGIYENTLSVISEHSLTSSSTYLISQSNDDFTGEILVRTRKEQETSPSLPKISSLRAPEDSSGSLSHIVLATPGLLVVSNANLPESQVHRLTSHTHDLSSQSTEHVSTVQSQGQEDIFVVTETPEAPSHSEHVSLTPTILPSLSSSSWSLSSSVIYHDASSPRLDASQDVTATSSSSIRPKVSVVQSQLVDLSSLTSHTTPLSPSQTIARGKLESTDFQSQRTGYNYQTLVPNKLESTYVHHQTQVTNSSPEKDSYTTVEPSRSVYIVVPSVNTFRHFLLSSQTPPLVPPSSYHSVLQTKQDPTAHESDTVLANHSIRPELNPSPSSTELVSAFEDNSEIPVSQSQNEQGRSSEESRQSQSDQYWQSEVSKSSEFSQPNSAKLETQSENLQPSPTQPFIYETNFFQQQENEAESSGVIRLSDSGYFSTFEHSVSVGANRPSAFPHSKLSPALKTAENVNPFPSHRQPDPVTSLELLSELYTALIPDDNDISSTQSDAIVTYLKSTVTSSPRYTTPTHDPISPSVVRENSFSFVTGIQTETTLPIIASVSILPESRSSNLFSSKQEPGRETQLPELESSLLLFPLSEKVTTPPTMADQSTVTQTQLEGSTTTTTSPLPHATPIMATTPTPPALPEPTLTPRFVPGELTPSPVVSGVMTPTIVPSSSPSPLPTGSGNSTDYGAEGGDSPANDVPPLGTDMTIESSFTPGVSINPSSTPLSTPSLSSPSSLTATTTLKSQSHTFGSTLSSAILGNDTLSSVDSNVRSYNDTFSDSGIATTNSIGIRPSKTDQFVGASTVGLLGNGTLLVTPKTTEDLGRTGGDGLSTDTLTIIIAAAGAAFLLIVCLLVACLCLRRKRRGKKVSRPVADDLWVDMDTSYHMPLPSLTTCTSGLEMTPVKQENLYKGMHPFIANQEGQLSFQKGDVIQLVESADNGWWRGVMVKDGASGWFPSGFVTHISDSTENLTVSRSIPEPETSPGPVFRGKPQVQVSSFQIRKNNDVTANQTLNRLSDTGRTYPPHEPNNAMDDVECWVNMAASISMTSLPTTEMSFATKMSDYALAKKGHKFRAVYAYKAVSKGEMALREGELVVCKERDRNGWMFGSKPRTQQEGWFPSVYVDEVSSDDESCSDTEVPLTYDILDANTAAHPDQTWLGIEHRAEFPYESEEAGDLTFDTGDVITVFKTLANGWWFGEKGEESGWFPGSFVQLMEDESTPVVAAPAASDDVTTKTSDPAQHLEPSGLAPKQTSVDASENNPQKQNQTAKPSEHSPSPEPITSSGHDLTPPKYSSMNGGVSSPTSPADETTDDKLPLVKKSATMSSAGGYKSKISYRPNRKAPAPPTGPPAVKGSTGQGDTTRRPARPAPAPPKRQNSKLKNETNSDLRARSASGAGQLGKPTLLIQGKIPKVKKVNLSHLDEKSLNPLIRPSKRGFVPKPTSEARRRSNPRPEVRSKPHTPVPDYPQTSEASVTSSPSDDLHNGRLKVGLEEDDASSKASLGSGTQQHNTAVGSGVEDGKSLFSHGEKLSEGKPGSQGGKLDVHHRDRSLTPDKKRERSNSPALPTTGRFLLNVQRFNNSIRHSPSPSADSDRSSSLKANATPLSQSPNAELSLLTATGNTPPSGKSSNAGSTPPPAKPSSAGRSTSPYSKSTSTFLGSKRPPRTLTTVPPPSVPVVKPIKTQHLPSRGQQRHSGGDVLDVSPSPLQTFGGGLNQNPLSHQKDDGRVNNMSSPSTTQNAANSPENNGRLDPRTNHMSPTSDADARSDEIMDHCQARNETNSPTQQTSDNLRRPSNAVTIPQAQNRGQNRDSLKVEPGTVSEIVQQIDSISTKAAVAVQPPRKNSKDLLTSTENSGFLPFKKYSTASSLDSTTNSDVTTDASRKDSIFSGSMTTVTDIIQNGGGSMRSHSRDDSASLPEVDSSFVSGSNKDDSLSHQLGVSFSPGSENIVPYAPPDKITEL